MVVLQTWCSWRRRSSVDPKVHLSLNWGSEGFGTRQVATSRTENFKCWWSIPALCCRERGSTVSLPSRKATSWQKLELDSAEVLMENNSTMYYEFQESGSFNYILSNNYYLVIVIAVSVCLHTENPFPLSRDSKCMYWFSLQSWATICIF